MTGRPTRKYQSNLDAEGALRNSHSQEADALRVIDIDNVVGQYWSHVELTYDANDSVTDAVFYYDKTKGIYRLTAVADVAGSLNNKYFLLDTAQGEKLYYVWYNVGGTGTDPMIAGREGIAIPINFNDPAPIVSLATSLVLDAKPELVSANEMNGMFKLENALFGEASIADGNTGFNFEIISEGVSEVVREYTFPPQDDIKYVYNPYEKTFEVIDTSPVEVVLESSAKTPVVQNIIALLANTEYNFPLPDDTKKFLIKVRENDTKLRVKFESAGSYIELKRGVYYMEDQLLTESVTIYFETNKPGKTVELIYWT